MSSRSALPGAADEMRSRELFDADGAAGMEFSVAMPISPPKAELAAIGELGQALWSRMAVDL